MPSTDSVAHDDLVVCACGNRDYNTRDVVHAALWRGELDTPWKDFVRAFEAEKRADEMELDLDEATIDAAAEAFRYQRDLITAEETEHWLAAHGLTLDDFSDYFARQYCGQVLAEEIPVDQIDYRAAPAELRQVFAADLIFSGILDRLTLQLIWRLAAHCAAKESGDEGEEERKFFERHAMDSSQLSNWLQPIGRDATWFAEMVAMEAAYRQRCAALLLPQSQKRELVNLRLPLTRFEVEVLELESRDAAQEALFCIREDGMSMEEVATEGRYPFRNVDFLLEDLPIELQQKFLSVSAGDLLEPMPRGDGFELCRIKRKIEPQADDAAVKLRIEQRLLDRHFSELTSKYVERRLGSATSVE